VLGAAGVTVHSDMKGKDLREDTDGHEFVFAEDGRSWHVMARDQRHKLIRQAPGTPPLLFDLKSDPVELHNMYGRPEYRDVAERLEAALDGWRGSFERPGAYVNHGAPVIDQPNVPVRNDGHREQMIVYCKTAMERHGVV